MSFSVEILKEAISPGDTFTRTPEATLLTLQVSPPIVMGESFALCLPLPAVEQFSLVFSSPLSTILQLRVKKSWRDENEPYSIGKRDENYDPSKWIIQAPSAEEIATHIGVRLSNPGLI